MCIAVNMSDFIDFSEIIQILRGKKKCATEGLSNLVKCFMLQDPPAVINYKQIAILPCPLSLPSSVRTKKMRCNIE